MERIPNFERGKSYFRAERKELRRGLTPFFETSNRSGLKLLGYRGGGTHFASERAGVSDTAGHRVCRIQKHTRSNHFMNLSPSQTEKPANPPPGRRQTSEQFQDANVYSEPSKNNRILTVALLVAVAIALGLGFWNLSRQLAPQLITSSTSKEQTSASLLPEKSVAVLPFENLSDDNENAFLADGVQGDILSALSKVADLKVIGRTSVNSYAAGGARNLHEIAETLGVAYVLEGTVGQTHGKVRITAQLTDARTQNRLWAETYERDLGEVFAIQSEIVQRTISQLRANVSEKEKAAIAERPTKDLTAYGLYVRANALTATIALNPQINDRLREAIQLLDQAIARDPDFYLAYCELSVTHDYLYFFGLDHTPERLALAEAALKAVVRLRPDAGETHLARANFFYRCYLDYNHARTELGLAERALPNNSQIFELTGYIDRRQGLWNESARSLQRALELDPRNFFMLQQIALSYQEFRQFGAMAAALDRALKLIPRDVDTRVTRALVDLEWKADPRPLDEIIRKTLAEDPAKAPDLAAQWFYVALCQRDPVAVAQALAAIPASGTSVDLNFPRSWCEGLAARVRGDNAAAQAAFLAARAEVEKTVREQSDYGPSFTVLGLIDAGLGRKEEALREGLHAVELLPITKDSIDGAEVMKYLGVIYAWCGEKDLAIKQITATLRIPSTLSYGNLKLHPYWDLLRGEPRFEKIVADVAPKDREK
jgi:TolB-like protein/Tfp pilus assembly protein PilF